MTVVPASFQLAGWIPAWWNGVVGGDDMLELLEAPALQTVSDLRHGVSSVSAYCPALGVSALPGPRQSTEAAVAAGEAVILHGRDRGPSHLLVPGSRAGWELLDCDPPRPLDLDPRQAAADMAEAVVIAEHAIRTQAVQVSAQAEAAAVRPLPPDADSQRRGLLVRAVRLWTAVAAVAPDQRTPELDAVLHACARATLAAYVPADVGAGDRRNRHARRLA